MGMGAGVGVLSALVYADEGLDKEVGAGARGWLAPPGA